ncbi:AAA family ATPase [Diaphorobacter aerolatus]|uniref:AAA family ATPase n=1 Tax=Diaphorobacter aerolatus TaxID=1288495 RepID=A0A7H0GPW1_9BURK|nr:AAA family ATPase [Diaphorobacter aerolatus]QNP50327.1 AAA family ATPase [Diaphorobacter aerolatus]
MTATQLKKIAIDKFRALKNVEIEFGDYVTIICGKNGTSKSSILGIAAQIFSFEKDYVTGGSLREFKQISGKSFKSQYKEHIRISEKFDVPGSLSASIFIHEGYTNQIATANLELMTRTDDVSKNILPRPVVRKNSAATGNTSRNFTHPVIFLSLKRLYPIADRDYKEIDFEYLKAHEQEFIALTNELLNRNSTQATGTHGTITSAVAHGDNYNHESVSAGEDNAGQIIMALLSFKKLKAEYADYKGGMLLIDEVDAGLFPTAQINLLKIFERECRNLKLQVVMTSHSPVMIEYAHEQSQHERSKKFKTVYLSNTFGDVQVMQDWSWAKISADIHTRTVGTGSTAQLPAVNVYFEDREAENFFDALISRQPIKKFTISMSEVTLGCTNFVHLIDKKVPEFMDKSVICLDSDARSKIKGEKYKTIVLLPGNFPPDQLIFQHLYNLPADDGFWENELQFTRDVFTNVARETISMMNIIGATVDLNERIKAYRGSEKPRSIFKRFYQDQEMQKILNCGNKSYGAWKHWVGRNPVLTNQFLDQFKGAIYGVMKNGYAVDEAKLSALTVNLKKVPNVLK